MGHFKFLEPASLDEACGMLAEFSSGAKLLAGGLSLVPMLKSNALAPSHVVDIKGLRDLSYIQEGNDSVAIGALTTFREIGKSVVIDKRFPALLDMERNLYDVQTRNWSTLGGNLCDAGRSGELAPVLTALGASVRLVSSGGQREVHLKDFHLGHRATALRADEILVEITIPYLGSRRSAAYAKESRRSDHRAISAVAVVVQLDERLTTITDAVIVLGGLHDTPVRASKAEQILIGQELRATLLDEASKAAPGVVPVISTRAGSADFRRSVTAMLTKKTLTLAIERCRVRDGRRG